MESGGSRVMVALQTKDGLAFGYVSDLSGDEVSFEVNSNIQVGEELAFRMELKGYEETVMGKVRVTWGQPSRTANWPLYRGKIMDIPADDRVLLNVWIEDMRDGGSSRRVERNPDDYVRDMFAKKMSGASSAATNLVIERMNARRARRAELFKKGNDVFKQQMSLSADAVAGEAKKPAGEQEREAIRRSFTEAPTSEPAAEDSGGFDLFDLDELD